MIEHWIIGVLLFSVYGITCIFYDEKNPNQQLCEKPIFANIIVIISFAPFVLLSAFAGVVAFLSSIILIIVRPFKK